MKPITTATKLFVLLGNPLGHSVSPPMHNLAFEHLSQDCSYFPVEVSPENLETVFKGLAKMNVVGMNVTIPHKLQIMDYLDELDPVAATIGAVNTVKFTDDRAKGYNTDGEGFIRSLEEDASISVSGKRFYIIGCGGAARAISMTLAFKGAAKIYLSNRTEEKAKSLAEEINSKIRDCARVVSNLESDLLRAAEDVDVIINSTSIGMHPHINELPLDTSLLQPRHIVADIVYNPKETALLKAANSKGCTTVEGLGMLLYQGVAAFIIWTGLEPPVAAMKEKLEALMRAKR